MNAPRASIATGNVRGRSRSLSRRRLWLALLLASSVAGSAPAAEPGRPSSKPLPSPAFETPEPAPILLPPIPPRRERPTTAPDGGPELLVSRWLFEGNTVFSDAELAAVVAPWTGRAIGPSELLAARDALTRHYIDAGYPTSGVLIPDQDVDDGVVRVDVVESTLAEIDIKGTRRLRDFYLRNQLGRTTRGPLNVPRLEEKIRLLQQDERIARVDASLRPGDARGEARLELTVAEADPIKGRLEASNHIAPSLGDVRGRAELRHIDLTGFGDELTLLVGGYEAGPEIEGRYRIPINSYGTSIGVAGRWTDTELVNDLGRELDIEGSFWNVELDVRQPLYRTPSIDFALGGTAALRQSNTELLGREINEVGGRTRVLVFRLYQELVYRDRHQVLALRSTTNFGASALGATRSREDSKPSSRFVSWLAQGQWLRRFDPFGIELLVRGEVQLTEDPLLSLEQISIGGHATVRGYRENQLIRDQGADGSIELRVPFFTNPVDGRVYMQLAPFFDIGTGWQRNRPTNSPTTIYSAGLAVRVQPWRFLRAELVWAERLADVERPDGLQGDGIQFRVVLDLDRKWLRW